MVRIFSTMNIVIINPTYNERYNIETLINRLHAVFSSMPQHTFMQLVVDDYSPDGTGEIVAHMQKQYKHLYLLKNNRRGLGAAYIKGIQYATDVLRADAVVQMDADLQHNHDILPNMIAAIERGADVVIASRFVKGGSLPKNWGILRTINSKVANSLARRIPELNSINDITSGYRVIRVRRVLENVSFNDITTDGYAFLTIFLYYLCRVGAKVIEIPLVFEERLFGNSKISLSYRYVREVAGFMKIIIWLRFRPLEGSHNRIV